ncbi:MAG: phosphoribosylanthranilate isomerase [Chloroflexota bacterium]
MITQLYTMQSVAEALACADAGADHLGITPPHGGLPGEVPVRLAAEIVDAVRGRAKAIVLTVWTDPGAIAELVAATRPDVLHLCPPPHLTSPAAVAAIRARLPGVPVMQAVSVGGPESVAEAVAFAAVADYLILDTNDPTIGGVGASGATHDWRVSRAIVEAVSVPVILAGGLRAENVAEAIRTVRPWGVDSLTHTNERLPDGGFRKDLVRVRAFIEAARSALAEGTGAPS